MDHLQIAEQMLAETDMYLPPMINADGRPAAWPSYLTHAILALCERLDMQGYVEECAEEEEED